MGPATGQGEDVASLSSHQSNPHHRYNTRSNRHGSATDTARYEARYSCSADTTAAYTSNADTHDTRETPLKQHFPPPVSQRPAAGDDETQEMETTPSDCMMDQVTYSTSNPVRAPFPSPAMKTSQPFYPFPPPHHATPLQEGRVTQQGIINGQCILVEAATRAQMAILVDDMSSMGFEQIEHT